MDYQHQEHGPKTWTWSQLQRKEEKQTPWGVSLSHHWALSFPLALEFWCKFLREQCNNKEIKSCLAKEVQRQQSPGNETAPAKASGTQGPPHFWGTLISGHTCAVNGCDSWQFPQLPELSTLPGSARHTATVPWRDSTGRCQDRAPLRQGRERGVSP